MAPRTGAPSQTRYHRSALVDVDIAVPVYNEAHVLAASVGQLVDFLTERFPFSWRVTIVDNASTDGTWAAAQAEADRDERIRAIHLDVKGRGHALRAAWTDSDATVLAYTDVDLSTDLAALAPLTAALLSGHSDVAIGSRLATGARVQRGHRRELISRCYNRLLRLVFANRFRDAQCGFKAVRADVATRILPEVVDNGWFFDTELLLLAERNGLRICEIPVDWTDDPDSRVRVLRTALDDLAGVARVATTFWRGGGRLDLEGLDRSPLAHRSELGRFATIGAASTVAYFAGFLVLRHPLGDIGASAVALSAAMLANTWSHRRFTFDQRGPAHRAGQWRRALAVHAVGLGLTTGAIDAAASAAPGNTTALMGLLLAASGLAAALRFVLLPAWIFRKVPPT